MRGVVIVGGMLAVVGCTVLAEQTQPEAKPASGSPHASPHASPHGQGAPAAAPLDWKSLEAVILRDQVQLTFPEKYSKAGESYFSPDGKWIIFQAVERNADGSADPNAPYAMYVAPVKRDEEHAHAIGKIVGLGDAIRISEPGSANTCGYFHPLEPWRVIFGSTVVKPANEAAGGYQRGTSRYKWMMPNEMEIVSKVVQPIYRAMKGPKLTEEIEFTDAELAGKPLFEHNGYDAECSYSPDGRFIVYASAEPDSIHPDLWVLDTQTNERRVIVEKEGYDGGPFFSPDGKRICYRSDRAGNDLLQLYVAELKFENGTITGIERETALTADENVNWGPYWHPSGEFLVYATSAVGHQNYEVFAIEVPSAGEIATRTRDSLKTSRVTSADGFDGLPVFDASGRWMMWTSQRGGKIAGEERPSSQVWAARFDPSWRPGAVTGAAR